MKNQPVEVVRIVGERINLSSKKRTPIRPHYAAMWKARKTTCTHQHKTRKAAARCIPTIERLRRDLLLFDRITKNFPVRPVTPEGTGSHYADGM
jgi:hypothetical protein